MDDERIVISSSAAIAPEAVAGKGFTTSMRGYQPAEVRQFLNRVADEMAAAVAREAELRRELHDALTRAAHPELDESVLTSSLGEHAGRLIASARETAAAITAEAERTAAATLRDAEFRIARIRQEADTLMARRVDEADGVSASLRQSAEADARSIRDQAQAEAEAAIQAARSHGKEMVAEARAVRERMLGDLARRRRVAEVQLEQLRVARGRLVEAYEVVRRTLEEVTAELAAAEPEARLAAEAVGRRMSESDQPPSRIPDPPGPGAYAGGSAAPPRRPEVPSRTTDEPGRPAMAAFAPAPMPSVPGHEPEEHPPPGPPGQPGSGAPGIGEPGSGSLVRQSVGQSGPGQSGPGQSGGGQSGAGQSGGASPVPANRVRANRAAASRVPASRVRANRAAASRVAASRVPASRCRPVGSGSIGRRPVGSGSAGSGQLGSGQLGADQPGQGPSSQAAYPGTPPMPAPAAPRFGPVPAGRAGRPRAAAGAFGLDRAGRRQRWRILRPHPVADAPLRRGAPSRPRGRNRGRPSGRGCARRARPLGSRHLGRRRLRSTQGRLTQGRLARPAPEPAPGPSGPSDRSPEDPAGSHGHGGPSPSRSTPTLDRACAARPSVAPGARSRVRPWVGTRIHRAGRADARSVGVAGRRRWHPAAAGLRRDPFAFLRRSVESRVLRAGRLSLGALPDADATTTSAPDGRRQPSVPQPGRPVPLVLGPGGDERGPPARATRPPARGAGGRARTAPGAGHLGDPGRRRQPRPGAGRRALRAAPPPGPPHRDRQGRRPGPRRGRSLRRPGRRERPRPARPAPRPLDADLTRALKRILQDEQNEVLEGLRQGGRSGASALVAVLDPQTSGFRGAAARALSAAYQAGGGTADDQTGATLGGKLAYDLVTPLKARLQRVIASAGDDLEELAEAVRAAYRHAKLQEIEQLVRHHTAAAHALGSFGVHQRRHAAAVGGRRRGAVPRLPRQRTGRAHAPRRRLSHRAEAPAGPPGLPLLARPRRHVG